ncbi:MAG: SBBP repeat-containing protein [Candidatus Kapabacteria bacterium]|nr:SBBP repeat-containing protein [Candidatus Kapabacteria bacterium]
MDEFEYDFVLKPFADKSQIKLKINDSEGIEINQSGELVINSLLGTITKNKPKAYQSDVNILCRYKINNINEVVFDLGEYDKSKVLIIDPVSRLWATYYGGSDDEAIYGVKTNSKKEVVISGYSSSNADIAMNGYQQTLGGFEDAFITKFDSNGVRIWATYFGGSNFDDAYDMAIDKDNNIIIVGETASDSSISTIGSHQEKYGGGLIDGFVAKFDIDGKIVWATYFGGKDEEKTNGVATDDFNNIYICGYTKSINGIYYQGFQQNKNAQIDGFVAKFNPLGELNWGTYYGGENDDYFNKITVDRNRDVIAVGITQSQNNIFFNGYQMFLGGSNDAFLVKFATGGTRKWATYYGGTEFDSGNSIVNDENNNIYFTGSTQSTFNISKNGYQNVKSSLYDAYLCKLDSDGMSQWATYLGGTGNDFGYAISYLNDNLLFAGTTNSTSPLSYLAFQDTKSGGTDGLFAKFNSAGKVSYISFYGSLGNDDLRTCTWQENNFYLGGFTNSSSNIAFNGHQSQLNGLDDGLLGKFVDTYFKLDSVKNHCVGESDSIQIKTNIAFTNANLFSIQLSDSIGDFTNPTVVGKFPGIGNTKVKVIYPNNLKSSANYKLRAVTSDPSFTSELSNTFTLSGKFSIDFTSDSICYSEYSRTITALDLNIFKYKWYIKNGTFDDGNDGKSISVKFGKPNTTTEITVVKTFNNCSSTVNKLVYIKDIIPFEVVGPTEVCDGKTYEYSIINPLIKSVLWSVDVGGIIIGNSNSKTVVVKWVNFNIPTKLDLSVIDNNGCSQSKSINISFVKLDSAKIIGAKNSCNGCEEIYFAKIDTNKYNIEWFVSNGLIVGNNNVSQIKIKWDNVSVDGYVGLKIIDKILKCDLTTVLDLTLSQNPLINFSPKRDTVCEFNIEKLVTSSGSKIINKWFINDGEKNIVIDSNIANFTWKKAGIGKIKLIKSNDSTKYKDSIEKQVYIVAVPKNEAIITNSSSSFCQKDSIFININYQKGLNYNFSWISNSVLNQINVSENQSRLKQVVIPLNKITKSEKVYFVTRISYGDLDCNIYYDTIPIYFVKDTIFIQILNDTLFADKGFDNYQWYSKNGKIIGAVNNYFVPNVSGDYTVETKYLSCIASAKINYIRLGVEDGNVNNIIKIYPNPSDGYLNIVTNKLINKYIIINAIGEIVHTNTDLQKIDLNNLANGFYNILLFTESKIYNEKFQLVK